MVAPEVDGSEKSGAVSPGSGIGAFISDMRPSAGCSRDRLNEFYPAYLCGHIGSRGLARGMRRGIVERTAGPNSAAR